MEFSPTAARLSPAEFVRRLRAAVEEHPAVRHPFLRRFADGRLARWQIWGYASQHYHLVSFFPSYLEAVAARTPDPAVRHVLREIVEEERMRPRAFERSHAALYRRFLRAIGFPEGEWERVTLLPETQAFVTTHLDLMHRSWLLGLGALGPGHELAIPRMFGYLVDGLERSLELDREALEYFHLHIDLDVTHGRILEEALARWATRDETQEEIRRGAHTSLEARAAFWSALETQLFGYAAAPTGP